jgi:crotonobetainyl-CoA:carnitine CoA-transferase CaiB-like acyl-CoA transferase
MTIDGPLAGVLVLDLSRALAGPHAAMMLGDQGARVIKIEPPAGDESRGWGPPFVGPDGARESTYFLAANRNKESITLDLKDPEDLRVFERLVRQADVLVENFRPGALARLGYDAACLHALRPQLVILSITGFGHDGPDADRPGYDQVAQGEGGLMSLTGTSEPTKMGVPIADLLAGMNGAFGVLAALHEARTTGHGTTVRTSLLASAVAAHAFQGTRWTVAGELPGLAGDHHPSIAPYGMFPTETNPIQIACGSEALWQSTCDVLGLDPDRPGFATNSDRVVNRDLLIEAVTARLATKPAEAWLSKLRDAGVPVGEVRGLDEVYSSEQVQSQGLLVAVEHPVLGVIQLPGSPLRLDDNAHPGGRAGHRAPPTLNEHGAQIREWLDSDTSDAE